MALSVEALPDLGQLRGLSAATLSLCSVRAVGAEHSYGAGWIWDTYTLEGVKAQRWKSVSSTRPNASQNWAKYRWLPEKPSGNASYYDPDGKLRAAIKEAAGLLYLVGGEVAVMSMFDAGYRNTTCFFGDDVIPRDTFYHDMKRIGVSGIVMIPDRDASGQKCAMTVRDLVKDDLDFDFAVLALPFEITDKHGKDVNEWWIELQTSGSKLRLDTLRPWRLPEPEQKIIDFPSIVSQSEGLPPRFVEAILRDVTDRADSNKAFRWAGDGWSTNFRCPFHDDQQASAGFNRESMSFKCFACGAKSAKQYGEGVGIYLKDYFDTAAIPVAINPSPQISTYSNGAGETPTIIDKPTHAATPQTYAPPPPLELMLTEAQKVEALKARKWLDKYIDWAFQGSPLTPRLFHEAMGLWLVATASTRRMKLRIAGEDIYPNLYIMIVARTSVYRKSTAMKLAYRVLNQAGLRALLLPDDATPEALFDELAGVKPVNYESLPEDTQRRVRLGRAVAAQRSFFKDEVSSMFANLKKDYMHGMETFYLQGYDADTGVFERRLKSVGLISVKDPCFSFLGATTPAMFAKYIGIEERIESGLAPRFAIITPDQDMPKTPPIDDHEEPTELAQALGDFFRYHLPWHNDQPPAAWSFAMDVMTPPVTSLTISPEAFDYLYIYRERIGYDFGQQNKIEDHLLAAYSRLGTMAYKVAMLLAGIEAKTQGFRVEARHAYAACQIVETWRESLHRLAVQLAQSSNRETNDQKVLALLKQAGTKGLTMREIMQLANVRPRKEALEALTILAESALIEQYDHKPEGRGRPTTYYRISQM